MQIFVGCEAEESRVKARGFRAEYWPAGVGDPPLSLAQSLFDVGNLSAI
jgi:hypothetical protein